jgi:hypothetical protein
MPQTDSGTDWTAGWVDPRANMAVVEKKNIFYPESNADFQLSKTLPGAIQSELPWLLTKAQLKLNKMKHFTECGEGWKTKWSEFESS